MPMDIYARWIKAVGVFILPIFVITNFPPLYALGKLPPIYLGWSLVLPIVLLGLVRLLWQKGLRSYASASS
jgi:ABC-2 type transport system permease protein